jgi:hypothetical protein
MISNSSVAAVDGVAIQRATAVSGGTGATEYSLNGHRNRGVPTADVTTTTTTATITATGAQTIAKFDLAASDREVLKFGRNEFTLENETDDDYDSMVIVQPLGTNVLTFHVLCEEN